MDLCKPSAVSGLGVALDKCMDVLQTTSTSWPSGSTLKTCPIAIEALRTAAGSAVQLLSAIGEVGWHEHDGTEDAMVTCVKPVIRALFYGPTAVHDAALWAIGHFSFPPKKRHPWRSGLVEAGMTAPGS